MPVLSMNSEMYHNAVKKSDKPVLVEFWAPWCTYCRRRAPALAQTAAQYQDTLCIGQINIDEEPALAEKEKIELVPTLLLYHHGKLLGSTVAPESKAQLDAFLKTALHEHQTPQNATDHIYDMIIIGGGPGGYTAALYAARTGLDVILLEKLSAGGQMALTEQIDNYPGFDEGIDGFLLSEKMRKGAEHFGAKTHLAQALSCTLSGEIKSVQTSEGVLKCKTIVLATGASPRELGIAGEKELAGHGVHYCAACDGMFYRNKKTVVIGGGNSAAADALLLSHLCKQVTIIHRRDTLRATKIYHKPLMTAANVDFFWNCTPTEFLHGEQTNTIRLRNTQTGEQSTLDCDGIFVSIGRKPSTELVKGQLTLDPAGYIMADETTRTNIPGVFAVGDVRAKAVRQIVTAVADGAQAIHYAEEYLADIL